MKLKGKRQLVENFNYMTLDELEDALQSEKSIDYEQWAPKQKPKKKYKHKKKSLKPGEGKK